MLSNQYPAGQCTWYCAQVAPWVLRHGNLGNALSWATAWASHGGSTEQRPAPGDIVCFQPGVAGAQADGHVALVLSVAGSSFTVSEMNATFGSGHSDDRQVTVRPGMTFLRPQGGMVAPPGRTVTVRLGDSMWAIAQMHGVTLGALERANPQVKNPNLIYPGQVLNLP